MDQTPPPNPDANKPMNPGEELKIHERLRKSADDEIKRVWETFDRVVKIAGILIGVAAVVLTAIVGWFGFRTLQDIKVLEDSAHVAISNEVFRIQGSVKQELERQFASENIRKLVEEKARERVEITAEPILTRLFTNDIYPKVLAAATRIDEVHAEIDQAKKVLKGLVVNKEFMVAVLNANNDDRPAFEQLLGWSQDSTIADQLLARQAVMQIINAESRALMVLDTSAATQTNLNSKNLDLTALRIDYLRAVAAGTEYTSRVPVITQIWNRKDLSRNSRISFLMNVYRREKSIRVSGIIAILIKTETGANFDFLDIPQVLKWWEENKDLYKDPNQLPAPPPPLPQSPSAPAKHFNGRR